MTYLLNALNQDLLTRKDLDEKNINLTPINQESHKNKGSELENNQKIEASSVKDPINNASIEKNQKQEENNENIFKNYSFLMKKNFLGLTKSITACLNCSKASEIS
jgi:hypothetical protein